MWYHWIIFVIGLYLIGSSVYWMWKLPQTTTFVTGSLQIAAGAGLTYYGYTNAMTPAASPVLPAVANAGTAMMGGVRKFFSGRK